jgi:hypothetical protein
MFNSASVLVTDTPTLIYNSDYKCQFIIIRNADDLTVIRLGGPNVTYDTGFTLMNGEGMSLDPAQFVRDKTARLFGIASAGQSAIVEILVNRF